MYTRPPQWNNSAATASVNKGYAPAVPNASLPQSGPSRTVPGNQTYSPQIQSATAIAPQNRDQCPVQHQSAKMSAQDSSEMVPSAQQNPVTHSSQPANTVRVQPAPVQRPSYSTQNRQQHISNQQSEQEYISYKIWNINGKNKVVDFNTKLTMAYLKDFANIHGRGGSGHAGNSTIGIVVCDYSNGTGEKSVTVKYNLDVEDVGFLYEAAMSARLGLLKPDPGINLAWIDQVQRIMDGWKAIPKLPDGSRPIPAQALNATNNALNNARAATTAQLTNPLFSYSREKNNPYTGKNGLAPCSKISIAYTPYRKDGAPSNYPWYIGIENFEAPLRQGKNGASSHNSAQAVNKRSAFINLSNDDFCAAMVAIQRFVHLWEHRSIPMIDEAYRRMAMARAEKQKAVGYGNQ